MNEETSKGRIDTKEYRKSLVDEDEARACSSKTVAAFLINQPKENERGDEGALLLLYWARNKSL